jgi:type II secretory pathway pseudopilin PulG
LRYGFFELQGRSGRYRVLEELGRDDTASFHLASIDGRSFVVVRRQLEERANDPGARNAFRRAQQLALRLPPHPHIALSLDGGERDGDPPFVVEEFVPSESFDSLRQAAEFGRPIPWQAAAAAVAGAAHAYDALYVALRPEMAGNGGISIAPDAISVSYDGIVKITDPAAELRGRRLSAAATYGYGTPELWNQGVRDERGLVFTLAALLWELCTGYRLFQAENERDARALFHAPTIDPLGPSFPGFPAALDQLMQEAFALDPRARPARPRLFGQRIDALVPDGKQQLARHLATHFGKGRQQWSSRLQEHAQEFQGGGPARVESVFPGAPAPAPRPSYDDDDDDARTGFFDASAQQLPPSPYGSPLGDGPPRPPGPANFGDDDEKTGFFDAGARAPTMASPMPPAAGRAPRPATAPMAARPSNFGDDDEKTGFFDPSQNSARPVAPVRAPGAAAERPAPAGFGDDDERTGFFDPSARVAAPPAAPARAVNRTAAMAASVDARPPPPSRPPPQAPSARVLVDDAVPPANPALQQTGFAPRQPSAPAPPAPAPAAPGNDGDIPFYQPSNVAPFPGAPPGFSPGAPFAAPPPPAPAPLPPGFAPPGFPNLDPNAPFVPGAPPGFPNVDPNAPFVPGAPPGFANVDPNAPFVPGAPPGIPAPIPMTGPSAATAVVPAATDPNKRKRELAIFALVVIVALLLGFSALRKRQAAQAAAIAEQKAAEVQAAALLASASAARAAAQVPMPVPTPIPTDTATAATAAPTDTATAPSVATAEPAPTKDPAPTVATPTPTKTTPTPTKTVPTPTPTPTAKVSGSGFVSVLTNPACDSATFDGKGLGACPIFKKSVPAGAHTVRIKTGGTTRSVSVNVEPGQVAIVR